MSYFLWVEDFENSVETTANNVLGSIIESPFDNDKRKLRKNLKNQGVFLELNFQDGFNFVKNNLNKIDYIILDIDLISHNGGIEDISNDVLILLEEFQGYKREQNESEDGESFKEACNKLKEIAGFYLYTQLVVELGFPKTHILFCSNHGENTKTIQTTFKDAKISLPPIYEKSNSGVQEWVKSCYENPYSRLRRGIIEGCQDLKNLTDDKLRFNDFIQEHNKRENYDKRITREDLYNYLDVLSNFLPLKEPQDKSTLYKLFVRTLAHEWESVDPTKKSNTNTKELFAFVSTMKMTRNWLAHSRIFESINEQDVAYLFMVNMRAMFTLDSDLLSYEAYLLKLFKEPIPEQKLKETIGDNVKNRKIPLEKSYATLLSKSNNTWQAINFHEALNKLQQNDKKKDADYLIKGLYQIFWFLTSNGYVFIPRDKERLDQLRRLNYDFQYFEYSKDNQNSFIFQIARHIYKRSFEG
jgi:hypothetical protein